MRTVEVRSGKNSGGADFRLARPVITRAAPPPSRGTVEGIVWEIRTEGRVPAPGITVRLDQARTAASGSDGRFRFADISAGDHHVGTVTEHLPVEFELGPISESTVSVTPGKTSLIEFGVIPVSVLRGRVSGPPDLALNGIVISLSGTERQTNTDATGNFGFLKLRDGDYTVVLESKTLPANAVLVTPGNMTITLRAGQDTLAEFRLELATPQKSAPAKRLVSPPISIQPRAARHK
jgi:hypothetical protein